MDPEMELQRRLDLQTLLQVTSGLTEDKVHFQPPTGKEMDFSQGVITYSRNRAETVYADNLPYRSAMGYTVTVIHKDPDNIIRSKIATLRYCSYDRGFVNEGLNHDVFTIFF